jgi:RHS repeat-associated protein
MSYEYDDENRLTAAQVLYQADSGNWQGWRTVFEYDGLSRLRCRLEFTVEDADGSYDLYFDHGVQYIYDGMRVIQERNQVYTTPTVSYTRGTDLSGSLEGAGGIGGLLARSSAYSGGNWTSHACYHADGNGNITCLIATNQSVVASYRYDPFGNTISSSGSLASANTYRFSSKEVHLNSGMYYYGYRFYDPNLQRWLNRDPISELGGINLYEFLQNSPTCRVDPDGHTPLLGWGLLVLYLWYEYMENYAPQQEWPVFVIQWGHIDPPWSAPSPGSGLTNPTDFTKDCDRIFGPKPPHVEGSPIEPPEQPPFVRPPGNPTITEPPIIRRPPYRPLPPYNGGPSRGPREAYRVSAVAPLHGGGQAMAHATDETTPSCAWGEDAVYASDPLLYAV